MAILGWIALAIAAALLASGIRRGQHWRVVAGRCVIGVVGALLAGLAATAAGVGAIEDFFDTATWLIAFGGAVLVLFAYELTASRRDGGETSRRAIQLWAGRAGGESETLNRNW